MTTQLKTVTKADNVSILFGEWSDKVNGNTYYDAEVFVGDKVFEVSYQYGYNAGDTQSIDEALKTVGYRVRTNTRKQWAPYEHISITCVDKLKRELFKTTEGCDNNGKLNRLQQ